MNLVFLDWMLAVPREDPERIDDSELPGLSARLEQYFAQQMPVRIDGVVVPPSIRAVQVNAPDESLLPLFPISGWQGLRKIFFNLAYPLKAPPDEIALAWPAYPPDLLSPLPAKPPLEIAAEWTADGLRSQVLFTRAEPGFTWRRPSGDLSARLEKVPTPPEPEPLVPAFATLAIVLFVVAYGAAAIARRPPLVALGTGLVAAVVVIVVRPSGPSVLAFGVRAPSAIDEGEACRTFEALQVNLYRAFDYDREESIYDALAQSVDGELLEETYLSVRRALVMEEEGGAMSRVVAVRPITTRVVSQGEIDDGDARVRAFTVDATWQVDGRVTHWGHMHDRTNEYDGRFTVAVTPEGWRIHDAEITRQERVDGGGAAGPTPVMPAEDGEL
ncbi:MAG: hypothetical protein LW806_00720 [Planctomycetaceae bacterium]|nr:hypothetical protein [Planctomycetaceae bacterium]